MEHESNVSETDPKAVAINLAEEAAKTLRNTLGLGNETLSRELDDEMQRPPDDRSPLT